MRILVVEDNNQLVGLLTKALALAGLDVDRGLQCGAAEICLKTMRYAAIVLDLGLPDADGLAVLDQMPRRRDRRRSSFFRRAAGWMIALPGCTKGRATMS